MKHSRSLVRSSYHDRTNDQTRFAKAKLVKCRYKRHLTLLGNVTMKI